MSVAEFPIPEPEFERTPPHDVAAEQCVLGGMLLSKDAIADVVEILRPHDFYRPAHQVVYDAVLDLYGRGEPADAVTVAAELTRTGELNRVGGAPYLHTLISSVPTAANAGYYAKIVRERAVLRRLVEAGTRIVQLGYASDGSEVDDIVDRAQAEVYSVTEQRTTEDYLPLAEIMPGALDEIEAISNHGGALVGVPTGFTDLDALMNGLHPGQMVIVAARPAVGKSTLGLDFARAAAVNHSLSTVIFSLEMSRNEITMRLLSAEAKVPLHHMRSGHMNDDDWTRLARRMSEVAEAPLFIDDSPNMTMMEIRAKCRRLKQRNNLQLVIVDYLQLMTAPRRVESRQQEVSELSRSLKLLAKELDVPVIAISQLNRGPEQRTDKKPQLSDLRESGCLTARTRVLRADSGAEVELGSLLESGERNVPIWSFDERLRLVPKIMTHVFPTGVKEVFRLHMASGREVHATANHPFLTFDGWCPLDKLRAGGRIAVPRQIPEPLEAREWADAEVILLAHLIGSCLQGAPVPAEFFSVPKRQIALFLRNLWAMHGVIQWDSDAEQARIWYGSPDRRLVDDVSQLLLRCGVMSRCDEVAVDDRRSGCYLILDGTENQSRFLTEIGVPGRGDQAQQVIDGLKAVKANTIGGTVPREVVGQINAEESLGRIATILQDADLEMLATNDVFWDEIVSIDSVGNQTVYDATVPGTHNFIADGIAVHNSIEQDSDVVILLYREDMFEQESPRAGEADLIVAKHRNGPTATVTVAFQGHYSRFVDMAPSL